MKESCPGSVEIRNPFPEELKCLFCGHGNEIWSDETEIQCKGCKKTIGRQMRPTCLDWCPAAKECVGIDKYNRIKKVIDYGN